VLRVPPRQAARLLDALGELGQPRTLTAPRPVLREAALVAIDELGEAVSGHCSRLLRGSGSAGEAAAAVAELTGLLELLRRIDSGGGGVALSR
jgi:hypothetical protein